MDAAGARRIIENLLGKKVAGWTIVRHRGTGKSAVVFEAKKDDQVAALKIFDPDLIELSGRDKQLARIDRQLELRGKSHPHLVKILDGGECPETGHLFIVMELLDAPNLASVLQSVPRDRIRPIIAQVASAARFLEDLNIVHRDIKPENIAISPDFKHATLLDVGVIRPVNLATASPSSDGERRSFVGTLRYSSPEFAFRTEKHDADGWRSLTFYQLGGVLHDLITRKLLFQEFSDPYTRLVDAVKNEVPSIAADDVPEDLILLARNCLLKSPELRLKFINWQAFEEQQPVLSAGTAAQERLRRRHAQTYEAGIVSPSGEEQMERAVRRSIASMQWQLRNGIVSECTGKDFIPRAEIQEFADPNSQRGFLFLAFESAAALGYPVPLSVLLVFEPLESGADAVRITCAAMLGSMPSRNQLLNAEGAELYSGVFQQGVVARIAMDLIYQLLEIAQSKAPGSTMLWIRGKEGSQR
jgi:eukaryotic-like serine/threonine-protein kinase